MAERLSNFRRSPVYGVVNRLSLDLPLSRGEVHTVELPGILTDGLIPPLADGLEDPRHLVASLRVGPTANRQVRPEQVKGRNAEAADHGRLALN
jgi:hypothetical protein